mmetsp:Transcript_89323/g.289190  ORF Transcript_89323/g.289190 Transcript_89323/m.289190 type:complete len:207 (-) Transcript_89323:399-1019(-)
MPESQKSAKTMTKVNRRSAPLRARMRSPTPGIVRGRSSARRLEAGSDSGRQNWRYASARKLATSARTQAERIASQLPTIRPSTRKTLLAARMSPKAPATESWLLCWLGSSGKATRSTAQTRYMASKGMSANGFRTSSRYVLAPAQTESTVAASGSRLSSWQVSRIGRLPQESLRAPSTGPSRICTTGRRTFSTTLAPACSSSAALQ